MMSLYCSMKPGADASLSALAAIRSFQMRFLMIATMVLALAFLGCSSIGSGQPIVFNSDREGNLEIFSVDPQNADLVNLTQSNDSEFGPAVSPDGKSLAFIVGSTDNNAMHVISLDSGKSIERNSLSIYHGGHRDHRWSPSSERIAYLVQNGSDPEAYIVTADGESTMELTSIKADEIGGWSYDGSTVAFVIRHDPDAQGIYLRNPDGVNQVRLTNTSDYSPVWSPNAHKLAFLSDRDGNPEVYVMNTDATEQQRLTQTQSSEYDIAWAPDGRKIAYVSERDGNAEIYVVDIRSGETSRLTRNNVRDDQPVWSRDSKQIAFVSYLDGDGEIVVMDANGRNQKRLTNNSYDDFSPSW